jgi:hypothetical protein
MILLSVFENYSHAKAISENKISSRKVMVIFLIKEKRYTVMRNAFSSIKFPSKFNQSRVM